MLSIQSYPIFCCSAWHGGVGVNEVIVGIIPSASATRVRRLLRRRLAAFAMGGSYSSQATPNACGGDAVGERRSCSMGRWILGSVHARATAPTSRLLSRQPHAPGRDSDHPQTLMIPSACLHALFFFLSVAWRISSHH